MVLGIHCRSGSISFTDNRGLLDSLLVLFLWRKYKNTKMQNTKAKQGIGLTLGHVSLANEYIVLPTTDNCVSPKFIY